ncbi:hypothetical protein CKAH01_19131, partial [Colletotrichum kahawae]
FEADAREEVSTVDEKLEPNGWLYRVGWTRDLEGVANKARATAAPHKVGHNVLFEAERKEISQKPVQPFDNRIEDDT